jgi:hypothetical protein
LELAAGSGRMGPRSPGVVRCRVFTGGNLRGREFSPGLGSGGTAHKKSLVRTSVARPAP